MAGWGGIQSELDELVLDERGLDNGTGWYLARIEAGRGLMMGVSGDDGVGALTGGLVLTTGYGVWGVGRGTVSRETLGSGTRVAGRS